MSIPTSGAPATVEIPAQGGAIVSVACGHQLRLIDVEGTQVADLFAVSIENETEWLSVSVTRAMNWRLFPAVGQSFFSTGYRALLTFKRDDSPGPHDMLAAPCSTEMYRALGYDGHHRSCSENFRTAASTVDWRPLHVPDPVNFFQRTPVDETGVVSALPALSRPGDSVTLRAEADIHVIVTACSMDLEPINGGHCTPLRVEVRP